MIGEIFSIQVCAYIEKEYGCSIHYEKIYFREDRVEFIFCIKDKEGDFYKTISNDDICWNDIREHVLDLDGFMQIKKNLINFLYEFDLAQVNEGEIRKQLILFSVLSLPTYFFLDSQNQTIKQLENLTYMQYQEYLRSQIGIINENGIKLIKPLQFQMKCAQYESKKIKRFR